MVWCSGPPRAPLSLILSRKKAPVTYFSETTQSLTFSGEKSPCHLFNRFAHSAGPGMEKHVGTELTTEGARSTQKPKDNGTGVKKNVGTI